MHIEYAKLNIFYKTDKENTLKVHSSPYLYHFYGCLASASGCLASASGCLVTRRGCLVSLVRQFPAVDDIYPTLLHLGAFHSQTIDGEYILAVVVIDYFYLVKTGNIVVIVKEDKS